jgi:hypothetical protein
MKAIERLMQYIDYKGFNKRAFEIDNGLSNGYLGKQLTRNADLGEGVLMKIVENCPDLSPEWLLTGNGEMIVAENYATVSSNKKPSAISDGFGERYVSLLERTVASLEAKIAELTKGD